MSTPVILADRFPSSPCDTPTSTCHVIIARAEFRDRRHHARIEAIAVAPIHARIAARSADGTAHTVRTGCGIADRGLHSSRKTRREAAACQSCGRPFHVTEPMPGKEAATSPGFSGWDQPRGSRRLDAMRPDWLIGSSDADSLRSPDPPIRRHSAVGALQRTSHTSVDTRDATRSRSSRLRCWTSPRALMTRTSQGTRNASSCRATGANCCFHYRPGWQDGEEPRAPGPAAPDA